MYPVYFDINDKLGNPSGKVDNCKIGALILQSIDSIEFKVQAKNYITINKAEFNFDKIKTHIGNIHWNGYYLEKKQVLKLINYLIDTRMWLVDEGPNKQYVKYKNGRYFDLSDVEELFN